MSDARDRSGGADLVRALESEWQGALDRVLRPLGYASADVGRLAPRVVELSRAYNEGTAEGRKSKLPLEARVAFSFPRDVPKGTAAVREIVADLEPPLRVVDLGAGLGAMTWGLARALEAAGKRGRVDAVLVDEDPDVLRAAAAIAREAPRSAIDLAVTTRTGTVHDFVPERADVVFLGQVLSEMDLRLEAAARVVEHAALIERLQEQARFVVVVEPALRDRTRHLHAVRDALAARGVSIAAPCLHASACPALAIEDDWCHEDLAALDLPPWVTPLAKAAGLRWQGLTFSYLVLQRDPIARPAPAAGTIRFRVTSDLLRSKGKVELFACCEDGRRPRIRRLERHGSELDALCRGDVVTLTNTERDGEQGERELPFDERGRIADHVTIDVGPVRR
ncbi:MAG: hypothetical protein KIT84_26900 [Labilithrix sp.]|nr:hypothetical protein [Labilithrix sp.]MCW5814684.1 hypothetical protein [Labilithrix sp.]